MRAPSFWNIKDGRDAAFMVRLILWPLSAIYNFFTQRRINKGTSVNLEVPTISIGNLTLGGTGKTPFANFLRNELGKNYNNIAIVSRGFGGKIKAPSVVNNCHTAQDVGDEPLMLSKHGMVVIGANRILAAMLAVKNGANLIILDDAHQNPSLKKNISIILIDGDVGFGNGMIFPSGPLREKPQTGLKRADLIVWVGDKSNIDKDVIASKLPIIFAKIMPINKNFTGKYIGFCGIGRPQKFEDSLKSIGVDLVDFIPFADHHNYSQSELETLLQNAKSQNAKLITTEKDFVRLPKQMKEQCEILEISLEFEDLTPLITILKHKQILQN